MKKENKRKIKNWLIRTIAFYILLLPFGYGLKNVSAALILAIFAGQLIKINDYLKKATE